MQFLGHTVSIEKQGYICSWGKSPRRPWHTCPREPRPWRRGCWTPPRPVLRPQCPRAPGPAGWPPAVRGSRVWSRTWPGPPLSQASALLTCWWSTDLSVDFIQYFFLRVKDNTRRTIFIDFPKKSKWDFFWYLQALSLFKYSSNILYRLDC